MEDFVFSPEYNFPEKQSAANSDPRMLDRLVAGLVHPMIHVGYGIEFGVKGMAAEGKLA